MLFKHLTIKFFYQTLCLLEDFLSKKLRFFVMKEIYKRCTDGVGTLKNNLFKMGVISNKCFMILGRGNIL